jgi:hypothetical protein
MTLSYLRNEEITEQIRILKMQSKEQREIITRNIDPIKYKEELKEYFRIQALIRYRKSVIEREQILNPQMQVFNNPLKIAT